MARISHTRSCVPRINLNHLNGSGVRLTPYEAVAVVHQVCELLKASDQRGHPLAPPTIDQLFITETGDIGIEPRRPGRANGRRGRSASSWTSCCRPDRDASEILSPPPAARVWSHDFTALTRPAPARLRPSSIPATSARCCDISSTGLRTSSTRPVPSNRLHTRQTRSARQCSRWSPPLIHRE